MNEPKVFISYSHTHDDAEWVCRFAEALREQRVSVLLDAWQVDPGESLRDALAAGLRGSDAVVAVLTPTNAQPPNLLFEFGAALGMGKKLIPIVPADLQGSAIPFGLRTRRYLTKGAPGEAAREVAEALRDKAA